MGVQYYGSQRMQGFGVAPIPGFPRLKGPPVRCAASEPTCSDFNQPTDPGGLREVLDIAASYKLADGTTQVPIWITQNGIADANDSKRPSYIVNHIAVVQDEIAHGMDIRGYTYWSFVDNLEWANGHDLEFGLLRVRPDDARAGTRTEAGQHRRHQRDHDVKLVTAGAARRVHPERTLGGYCCCFIASAISSMETSRTGCPSDQWWPNGSRTTP
jgi:beta-glucosidase/6-phospho-beta-glucosidase/beta-galactosidase